MDTQNHPSGGRIQQIDTGRAISATLIGLLPGFGLYMLGSLFAGGAVVVLFPVGVLLSAVILYQAAAIRTQIGQSIKLVCAELFLLPIAGIFFSTSGSEAALGGLGIFVGGFVIGYPVAIALFVFAGVIEE